MTMHRFESGSRMFRLPVALILFALLALTAMRTQASPSPLSATLLPASGGAQGVQLALNWRGASGALVDIGLQQSGHAMTVIVKDHALRSGINLLPLSLDPAARGTLQLRTHTAAGAIEARWSGDLDTLRNASGLAWQSTFFGPGVDNNVLVTMVWDDGSGPALYAGGLFLTAGGKTVNRVARWDGSHWSALTGSSGTGVDGSVFAMTGYDGALVIGGQFTHAGGVPANNIARWDGSTWSALGAGTDGSCRQVQGLTAYGNDLIAVGCFTGAGGISAHGVASWDGNAWSPLGLGVDSGTAFSAGVYGGKLIVGGNFVKIGGVNINRIAQWDGSTWAPLGSGVDGAGVNTTVYSMALVGSDLIAGGLFPLAGGATVNNVARWNGSTWSALGNGVSGGNKVVYGITAFGTQVIVGGSFTTASGVAANHVASWDGSAWSALTGTSVSGTDGDIRAVAAFDGALIIGGVFAQAGGIADNRIARWTGSDWTTLAEDAGNGVNGQVFAAAVYAGALVVGGDFTQIGNLSVNRIARWDGSTWSALGNGVGGGSTPVVDALVVHDGALIVGGQFTTAGSVTSNNIARWDGSAWSALAGPSATGANARVWSLAEFDGALIAGGQFSTAGGVTVNNVARWDGSAWSALVGALGTGADNRVIALTPYDGALILAGNFVKAGGVTANYVARWDGSDFSALSGPSGTGVDNRLAAVAVYDGALIVGGGFASAGGVPANNIARWDGTAWSALDTGLTGSCCAPWVRSLGVFDDALIAGGIFSDAGGATVNQIARWDGTIWSALDGPADSGMGGSSYTAGGGFNTSVATLVVFDPDGSGPLPEKLVAGGSFSSSGGVPNWGVAIYGLLDFTATPDPLDFGSVVVGESRGPSSVTLTNHSAAPISVSQVSAAAAPFAAAGGSCAAPPFTLAVGDACTLDYTFSPTTAGAATATVTILSDAPSGPHTFALHGIGTASSLDIAPDPLDFGTLITGETGGPSSVTLTNADTVAIDVSAISAPAAPFAATGGSCGTAPFTLAPSASCTLAYTFSPTVAGDASSNVVVTSNASGSPNTFVLEGSALLRELTLAPNPIDFGAVAISATSAPTSLELHNTGVVDVTVSDIAPATLPFATVGSTCAAVPFTLAAGDSCRIDFTFSPTAPGAASATFAITSNALSSPDTVTLQGSGSGAAIGVDPASFAVTVGQGHTNVQTLTIANAGNQPLEWQVTENPGAAGALLRPLGAVTIPATLPGAAGGSATDFFIDAIGGQPAQSSGAFAAPADATTITQSDSFVIQTPSTVGCEPPGFGQPPFPTAKTSFYRAFTLSDYGINGQFDVSEVTFGIEMLTTNSDLTVNLYTLNGALAVANLTLIGSVTQNFAAQTLQAITVPVIASVPPGATLVVEIAAPGFTGHNQFLPGSNNLGQTGPSYVNSFGQCSVNDITDYAALGQPDVDLVMSVTGTPVSCALPSWASVTPTSGTVAGGDSADAQVTFDAAGVAPGTVEANLCLASNDPMRPLTIVPLSMTVIVLDTFTVTPSVVGGHGTITPDTPQTVDEGYTTAFTLTPDAGYHLDAVDSSCGGDLVGAIFTTAPVTADCAVEVSFAVDAASAIAVVSGTPQATTIDTAFANPLVVRVSNAGDVGVPGVQVAFDAPASGAGATLPATAITDANGEVAVAASANSVAGSYTVHASAAGLSGTADFALTNTAGAAHQLVLIQGSGQSASTGTTFAIPLTVQVIDAGNNPVSGAIVDFTAPGSGPGATLSAASATTDANGVASVIATANAEVGSYAVEADVAGVAGTASFALVNTAPAVDLGVSIDDGQETARYGHVLDYLVTVHNGGSDIARGVDVAATLPAQLDERFATWICLDAASGACTASGSGALTDSGVIVPVNGNVSYVMSVPIRVDAEGADVTTMVTTSSADDPAGADASDTDLLVLFGDGFESYGASADPVLVASPHALGADEPMRILLPTAPGGKLVDSLLDARAADGSGFRVERLNAASLRVRLVAVDSDGNEHASAWQPFSVDAALTLVVVKGTAGNQVRLSGSGIDLEIDLQSSVGAPVAYRIRALAPK